MKRTSCHYTAAIHLARVKQHHIRVMSTTTPKRYRCQQWCCFRFIFAHKCTVQIQYTHYIYTQYVSFLVWHLCRRYSRSFLLLFLWYNIFLFFILIIISFYLLCICFILYDVWIVKAFLLLSFCLFCFSYTV